MTSTRYVSSSAAAPRSPPGRSRSSSRLRSSRRARLGEAARDADGRVPRPRRDPLRGGRVRLDRSYERGRARRRRGAHVRGGGAHVRRCRVRFPRARWPDRRPRCRRRRARPGGHVRGVTRGRRMTLVLVVAIPLAAAIAVALAGGRLGRRTLGIATTVALALSFGAAASMIASLREHPSLEAYIGPWLPIGGADFALAVDSGMLAVTLAITGVSALIALYSIAYLEHGRGLQRYFAAFSLLVAALLIVVLGSNLLLIFAWWELAGVSAYLLIGHHQDDPRAAASALRAFLLLHARDAALLSRILLLLATFHTVDLAPLGGTPGVLRAIGGGALV